MPKSIVSMVKGTDVQAMVGEAISLIGGLSSLLKPGAVIVVKPNAGHPFPPETSVNTSPEVVGAVIKELRKADPKEIILAEAAAVGCDTLECFEISGIGRAAKEAGVDRIIDIKRESDLIKIPIRDARSDMTTVLLPRFLVEADHIVNLPIFKTHVAMVFSCALKNLKGVVQDKVHRQMHQTNLAKAMMDLWSVVRADLSIADVIRPGEGFGPHSTMPVDFGCIVVGRDPVAVDATICRMVGLDIDKVPYFRPAHDRGLGNFNEKRIEVRGNTIEEVYKKLWIPYLGDFNQWPEYHIYPKGACSSCQGLLAFTMEKLKALGEYDENAGMSIFLGPKKELPKGVDPRNLLLMGDCLRKHRNAGIFVQGCPPFESATQWSIVNRADSDKWASEKTTRGRVTEYPKMLEHMKAMKKNTESG